jgi:hypothetical protein
VASAGRRHLSFWSTYLLQLVHVPASWFAFEQPHHSPHLVDEIKVDSTARDRAGHVTLAGPILAVRLAQCLH